MIKKLTSLILTIGILFTFTSCTIKENNKDINNNSTSIENNTNKEDKSHLMLISKIKNKAETGGIINSEFKAGINIIDDVTNSLGEANSSNYIANAKGTYYTFDKHNVVFGCNKGGAIFEARSFDSRINNLNLENIKKVYGKPDYNIVTENKERIIGYKINDNYKILFVFSKGTEVNPKLHHYSVLYPKGTINSMASNPGRQW